MDLVDENKKLKNKINKLEIQNETLNTERKALQSKQMQEVNIRFELEDKVNHLKKKVKNLKLELNEKSPKGNFDGDNKLILLEINRKTDNNFESVEEIIRLIKELEEDKMYNFKRESIKNNVKSKVKSQDTYEVNDCQDTIDKYKSENQRLKDKLKEKNKEVDDLYVDYELAKSYQEKSEKLKIRLKESQKKNEDLEKKLELIDDEIKIKDKKNTELQNKINSINEEAHSHELTVGKVDDENKILKKEKLEMNKTIETLKKENEDLKKSHKEEIKKKQQALDLIRSKVDKLVSENNDLADTIGNLTRENQLMLENKNCEILEKENLQNKIVQLETKISDLKSTCINQQKQLKSSEKEIEVFKTQKNFENDVSQSTKSTLAMPKFIPLPIKKTRIPEAPSGAKGEIISCPNCQSNYYKRDIEKHMEECIESG